jgi:hypothetical protein
MNTTKHPGGTVGSVRKDTGADTRPVRVREGEYFLNPETVAHVGGGSYEKGVAALNSLVREATGQEPGGQPVPQGTGFAGGGMYSTANQEATEYMNSVGPAWAQENAAFEQSQPGFVARLARALNPLTGLGSAAGAMHDAAGVGDKVGMGLAGVQGLPVFGALRAVTIPGQGLLKASTAAMPNALATAGAVAGSSTLGAGADTYQPEDPNNRQPLGFAAGGAVPELGGDNFDEVEDPRPLEVPDIDWVARAESAYSASTSYFDTNVRAGVEADLRQFNSEHPAGSKYHSDAYKGRSRLFRPKTRGAVTKAEATAAEALFSSYDVVNVEALDKDDPGQVEAARFAKQLLQIRLTTSIPWFLIAMGAFQDATVVGTVVSKQTWLYDEKRGIDRPNIDLVPIENFRFDPAANWADPVGTSPYLVELIPLYVKDVKARVRSGAWLPVSEEQIRSAARRQSDSIRTTRDSNRTDSTDNTIAVSDYSIVWVHENIVEEEGADWLYYTLGTTEMLSEPVPLQEKYMHGRPFAIGRTVIETHKNYSSGAPRLTRDVQAEINSLANLRVDNVNFTLNKRYFAKRNAQVDIRSITRNVPGSVTLMNDPATDVKVVDTPDVTGSAYQEQDRLNLDFDDVAGVFSGSSVQSNRRLNETVGGMNLLTSDANKVTSYRLRTFVESWVEPALRQVLQLERHYETDMTMLGRAARGSGIEAAMVRPEMFDALLDGEVMLNVNVGMSATNPAERINQLMVAINGLKSILADGVLVQYGLDVSEVIKEVFAGIGYRDGSRFFSKSEDPNIAALEAKLAALQQALDAKLPPELLAAQVAKLDAEAQQIVAATVETGVKSAYASMQAGQVIASVPGVAPIADMIMASAGYQPPNPAGVDPNFPMPGPVPVAGMSEAAAPVNPAGTSTDPMSPASPNVGQAAGIETQRADGVL